MRLTHCDRCKRVIPDGEHYRRISISMAASGTEARAKSSMDLCGGCYDDVLRVIEAGVVETPGRPEEP